jgi:hypothetical protein
MKYALFAGYNYYPSGGMCDLIGRFDTIDEARMARKDSDWYQIVDTSTFAIVEEKR